MKPEKIFALSILVVVVCMVITIIVTKGTRHEPRIIDKRVNVEDTKQYKNWAGRNIFEETETISKDTTVIFSYRYDSVYAYGNWYYKKDRSLKDSLEILKDQIKMKDEMIELQKQEIEEMKNVLRSK